MKKRSSAALIITLLTGLIFCIQAQAETYYAIANGNWNSNTTWSLSSGGPAVDPGIWPLAGDIVYISEGATAWSVTIPSGYSASCAAIYMGSTGATAGALTLVGATASLNVSGNVIVYGPGGNALRDIYVDGGNMTIGGNLELGNGQTSAQGNRICRVTVTTGSISVVGNLVFNNVTNSSPNQTWIVMTGGAGTFNLAGTFIIGNNIGRLDAGTTSTFNFNGTLAPQSIPIGVSSIVYNHITTNNTHPGGATLSAEITATNVTGNLGVQSGTLNNGGFAITLAATRNFSVSNGAIFNLTGTSTMVTVSGGGTKTFDPNSLVNYAGTSQTVSADTYGNLTFSGAGVKTFGTGNTIIESVMSMEGSATTTLTGTLTYRPGATLQYKGSVPQVTGIEFPATYSSNGGVIINNPNGVTLNASRSISSFLYLTNGLFNTLSYTLKISYNAPGAISGGSVSSYINGNLQRSIAAGSNSYLYPIGNSSAYTPVSIDFQAGTVAGTLLAFTTDDDHPDILNSFLNSFRTVNRYWTLTAISGLGTANYDATFNWVSADEDAPFTFSTASCGKYDDGTWTYPTMGTLAATSAHITGVSGFSDFQVGNECDSYPTAVISGGISSCSGEEVTLTVDLTGTPPWTYNWYDGENIYTVSDVNSSPSFITVYPAKNTTYTVVDVKDGVGCIESGSGSATVLVGPSILAPHVTASPGMISVPLIVKDFNDVGAISMTLTYDKSVISYDSYTNNSGLIQYFSSDETGTQGVIRFSGITLSSWDLNDEDILLIIYFNYIDGFTDLQWDDSGDGIQCEFAGLPPDYPPYCDLPTGTYYINGSVGPVSPPPPPPFSIYWIGVTSSDWYTGSNWSSGVVPTWIDNVVIDATPPNFPVFIGDFTVGDQCHDLALEDAALMDVTGNFHIQPGHSLDMSISSGLLRVGGSWDNNGIFLPGNGTVEFFGTDPSDIGPALNAVPSILDYEYETFVAALVPLTGATLGPTGDNAHLDIDLGFAFFYNGYNYPLARINTNGWLSLDRSGDDIGSSLNETLFQNGSPQLALAPWWDNLKADGSTSISYKTENGVFTCEWKDILAYNTGSSTRLTFQLKLYQSTGTIEFIYGNSVIGTSNVDEGASIGIKDNLGGIGHFREGTTGTNNTVVTNLTSAADWPVENIRFRLPVKTDPEVFWRILVTKTGGEDLGVQRDVRVLGQ